MMVEGSDIGAGTATSTNPSSALSAGVSEGSNVNGTEATVYLQVSFFLSFGFVDKG